MMWNWLRQIRARAWRRGPNYEPELASAGRVTRTVGDLIERADSAFREEQWEDVEHAARMALALDPGEEEAAAYLRAAVNMLSEPETVDPAEDSPADDAEGSSEVGDHDEVDLAVGGEPALPDEARASGSKEPAPGVQKPLPGLALDDVLGPLAAGERETREGGAEALEPEATGSAPPTPTEHRASRELTLGVDFGTTNTRVAVYVAGEELPQVVPIGRGPGDTSVMPSVAAYRRTAGNTAELIAVGEDALEYLETEDPAIMVLEDIKRVLVATGQPDARDQAAFSVAGNPAPPTWWDTSSGLVLLWDSKLEPGEVVAAIIEEAIQRAVAALNRSADSRVQGIEPASAVCHAGVWALARLPSREALALALRSAGLTELSVDRLRAEPVLGAIGAHYGQDLPEGAKFLVYDLGGGTFDTAIVLVGGLDRDTGLRTLCVLAADGEPFLGGTDIDRALEQYLLKRVAPEVTEDDVDSTGPQLNPLQQQQLQSRSRRAKETLADVLETEVAIPAPDGGASIPVRVTRAELADVVRRSGIVDRTLDSALRAFRRAAAFEQGGTSGKTYDDVNRLQHEDLREAVDGVVVIGGSTRVPYVHQAIVERWGSEKVAFLGVLDPMTTVVAGASLASSVHSELADRLSFSIALCEPADRQCDVYVAYDETVEHRTLTPHPGIFPKRFSFPTEWNPGEASLVLRSASGCEIGRYPVDGGSVRRDSHLEIDALGRILIKAGNAGNDVLQEFLNPEQLDMQARNVARDQANAEKEERRQRQRMNRYINRSPFLDN